MLKVKDRKEVYRFDRTKHDCVVASVGEHFGKQTVDFRIHGKCADGSEPTAAGLFFPAKQLSEMFKALQELDRVTTELSSSSDSQFSLFEDL